jgi:hypothetical protein
MSHLKLEIPCLIISYNNITFVKKICKRISENITNNIIIIDNNSSFGPMVDFLDNCKFKTIRLNHNHGHEAYKLQQVSDIVGSIFLLTDPDIEIAKSVNRDVIEKMIELSEFYKIPKVGLALEINSDNIRKDIKYENLTIKEWESKYWNNRVADQELEMYWADIDTTFCLVNKNYWDKADNWPYIRIAGKYTSKHLPWYEDWEKVLMLGEYDSYMNGNRSTNWCKN